MTTLQRRGLDSKSTLVHPALLSFPGLPISGKQWEATGREPSNMERRERGLQKKMLEPMGQGKQMSVDRARVTMYHTQRDGSHQVSVRKRWYIHTRWNSIKP